MDLCQFTSESYPEHARAEAWQHVLAALGLRSSLLAGGSAGSIAVWREGADGVSVARLSAAAQVLSSSGQRRLALPLFVLAIDGELSVKTGSALQSVGVGDALVLPLHGDWQVIARRPVRILILGVTAIAFPGRRIGASAIEGAQVPRDALSSVLSRTLEAAADVLDTLAPPDWSSIAASLAEMLLAVVHRPTTRHTEPGQTSNQQALRARIGQTIERRLGEPDLTPARVAQAEGISERYLQKLFELTGDTFTLSLRERRLQRAWLDLSNPAGHHHAVSEIAFRNGFNDAAHFSRVFRDRFGLSPRALRQQESVRPGTLADAAGQRGWPKDAVQPRQLSRTSQGFEPADTLFDDQHGVATGEHPATHHHLAVTAAHVHWGYFSRALTPLVEIASGDTITIETLTQHASDDPDRMIRGDAGAESVFRWTREGKGVERRGAGPMDASIFGRGAGEGFGVHICTGPVAVRDAQPGDVLEVRILDIVPRPSRSVAFAGRTFGSSVAAWWGYHYAELVSEPRPREVVTLYEIVSDDEEPHIRALHTFRWQPQTDPFGVVHTTYDYPGVPVAPERVRRREDVLAGIRIPLRPHFGVVAVAPRETDLVDSIPPAYFGGNLDNWRLGRGAAVYLPVSVPGALLSVGDPHAAQGDGELGGTAIECSMTGTFAVTLHKKADLAGRPFADLTAPLIETATDWVLTGFSHPNYLAEFGAKGQSQVYAKSSLDLAMKDAFRKVRRFLMDGWSLSEDETIALISAAVDFGVTQVVDGNWGVHAIVSKRLFETRASKPGDGSCSST